MSFDGKKEWQLIEKMDLKQFKQYQKSEFFLDLKNRGHTINTALHMNRLRWQIWDDLRTSAIKVYFRMSGTNEIVVSELIKVEKGRGLLRGGGWANIDNLFLSEAACRKYHALPQDDATAKKLEALETLSAALNAAGYVSTEGK